MPDVSLGLVLVVASASVFGPLSGWLAGQRMRNIALWGIFGIILGPVAPALLMSAPPGRCAACRWPVAGWDRRCAACGADVRTGASLATDAAEAAASAGPALAGTAPAASEPPESPISHADGAPVLTLAARTRLSAPAERARRSASASPTDIGPPAATASDGEWTPRVLPTELGRPPVEAPPVSPMELAAREPASDALAILGRGVYAGGNRRLEPGNRYLLARVVDELQILGPVHMDPAAIADRIPLVAIEAFVLEERLIIESRDGRADISMSFVAVSLQHGVDIQAALGASRSAAPAE